MMYEHSPRTGTSLLNTRPFVFWKKQTHLYHLIPDLPHLEAKPSAEECSDARTAPWLWGFITSSDLIPGLRAKLSSDPQDGPPTEKRKTLHLNIYPKTRSGLRWESRQRAEYARILALITVWDIERLKYRAAQEYLNLKVGKFGILVQAMTNRSKKKLIIVVMVVMMTNQQSRLQSELQIHDLLHLSFTEQRLTSLLSIQVVHVTAAMTFCQHFIVIPGLKAKLASDSAWQATCIKRIKYCILEWRTLKLRANS